MHRCPACDGVLLSWGWTRQTVTGARTVPDGRLRTSEVETVFFLGCDECSETITIVSPDDVMRIMNKRPQTFIDFFEEA